VPGSRAPGTFTPVDDLTAVLLAARDGDQGALIAAIRRSQPDVWRCCAWLVDRDAADDLVQETYLRMLRALPAYRAEASGRTWLLAIARRACADALRRRVRRRRLGDRHAELAAPPQHAPDDSRDVALAMLLDDLDPDRREAFVLTQLVGCSYEEAALACRVPVGTIRSRVARARRDLTTALRAAEAS
jgi:RNA polymerase sigma-70 factor, ECF subfamily